MSDQTLPTAAELRSDMRDDLASLRSRLKEAEGLLQAIEWDGSARANNLVCPFCGAGSYPMHGGRKHRADCELDAFLAGSTQGTPADSNGGGR